MSGADKWLLWIAANEVAAGIYYFIQGDRGMGWQWVFYGLACVAFAFRSYL